MANPSSFVIESQAEIRAIEKLVFEAEERAARLAKRYAGLGSNSMTRKHFFVDGDVAGVERDDLDYTYLEYETAMGNLEAIAGLIDTNVLTTLLIVTG